MSQHAHDMTAQDHVLTVLPLFHVGGLNIQTTPALQLGATVTLHARFAPDADARRVHARPADARRAGPRHHPGGDRASVLGRDRHQLPARAHHRLDAGAAGPGRCVHGARRAGDPGLRLDRDLPDRGLYARRRRPARGLDRPARPGVRGAGRRRWRQRGRARRRRRGPGARAERVLRILGQCGGHGGNVARQLVSFRRHRHARCRRALLHPRPQEEHDHLGRREHLSGRGRARAGRAPGCRRSRRDRARRSEVAGGAGRLCGAPRRQHDRRARARGASAERARALQGAARVRVRGLAAAQRDGQGAALSSAAS